MLYRVQKWERKNHCLRPPPKVAGKTTPDRRPNWMTRSIKEWRGGVEREGITCKNPKKIPSYLLPPSAAGKGTRRRQKMAPPVRHKQPPIRRDLHWFMKEKRWETEMRKLFGRRGRFVRCEEEAKWWRGREGRRAFQMEGGVCVSQCLIRKGGRVCLVEGK